MVINSVHYETILSASQKPKPFVVADKNICLAWPSLIIGAQDLIKRPQVPTANPIGGPTAIQRCAARHQCSQVLRDPIRRRVIDKQVSSAVFVGIGNPESIT